MDKRFKIGLKVITGALLISLLLVLCGVVPLNLTPLRKPIASLLENSTGLVVSVSGQLRLRLGSHPTLQATQLKLLSGDGAGYFARLASLDLQLQLTRLLDSDLSFTRVSLSGLSLDICQATPALSTGDGTGNAYHPALSMHQLEGRDIEIVCSSDPQDSPIHFGSMQGSADSGQDLAVTADMQWRGSAFDVDLGGAPLDELLYSSQAYPFQLNVTNEFTKLELTADAEELFEDLRLRGSIKTRLEQPDMLLALLDIEPAGLPVMVLEGRVDYAAGQLQLDVVELQSRLGSGSGRITLDRTANCPAWTAEASFSKVDLGAVGELIGLGRPIVGTLEAGQATLDACGESLTDIRETFAARATLETLQIHPGSDLPVIRATDASIATGWRHRTYLEANLLLDEQAVNGRLEAGELAQLNAGIDWPVRLELQSGYASLEASGSLRNVGEESVARADLQFAAPRLGPLATLLGLNPAYQGAVALGMQVSIDSGLVQVSDFLLSLDKSDLAGQLLLQPPGSQLDSELGLRSRLVDFDELLQLLPPTEEEPPPGNPPLDIDWPNLKLDLAFAELRGPQHSITDVSLVGSVHDERIEDARLGLEVAAFSLVGQLDADLGEAQPRISMSTTVQDIDVGSILTALDLAEDTHARARQVQLLLTTSGRDWHELIDNTELDVELQQLDWGFLDQISGQASHLSLQEIVGTVRPNTPVSLHLAGRLDEFPVNGYVQLAPIGQVLDPVAPLPIRAVLGTDRETVMLDGVFHRERGTGLQATLQLSAMEQVVPASELVSLRTPLPGLIIDAGIALGQDRVQTVEMTAALGSSRLAGKVVVRPSGDRHQVLIELTAPHLQTTDFSSLVAVYAEDKSKALPSTDSETDVPSFLNILEEYLQGMPELYDFDIHVNVDELMAHEDFLGTANLRAKINQRNLELGSLQLSLPGGDVDLNYTVNHLSDGVHAKFDAHIERFEIGGLIQTLDPESRAGGILYIDTAIDAVAPTLPEVTRTMQGHFDLALFPRNVGAKVLDLWATNLIFALMPRVNGERKEMNCLVARFDLDEGVMHSRDIILDSTEVVVRGKGTIDLGQRELDLIIAPQAKRERFLSVSSPIAITGPFDDFNMGLAGTGWVGTAFRWYLSLIYVPWKWLTGERFPEDGTATCLEAMGWEVDNSSLPTSNVLQ
jgi:hypothetical protein